MVDIVTAILIGFCFAALVGAFTFLGYKRSENDTKIRIQEIQHGVVKETKKADFGTGYTPMWTERRYYPQPNVTPGTMNNSDSITEQKNVFTSNTTNKTCDLDPTTAFPKVEEAKSYKAEPNESVA